MFVGMFFPLEVKFRWFESSEANPLAVIPQQWQSLNQECKCWFVWLLLDFSFYKHELSQLSPEKITLIVVTLEQIGINKR